MQAHYDHSGELEHWGKKSLLHLGEAAHTEAATVTIPSAHASSWCPDARSQPGGSTSSGR